MTKLKLPEAPQSIQKGVPLKHVLGHAAVEQLGSNLKYVYPGFKKQAFVKEALEDIEPLALKERGFKIAALLKKYLPNHYTEAGDVILASLTPPQKKTSDLGLSGMFYLPHVSFVSEYGQDKDYNGGRDPFDVSMKLQYELTKRFTSEFSIRSFIISQPERTFRVLYKWMYDDDPHVRRLCSEGSRPRLPWAPKISALVEDPSPSLKILDLLKDDIDLYVRRSVANHVGDIAKDNLDLALDLCRSWLKKPSRELKWVIRHALRHPAKKQVSEALEIRQRAK